MNTSIQTDIIPKSGRQMAAAAAQESNLRILSLQERKDALAGIQTSSFPLDREMLELIELRFPYDQIAELLREERQQLPNLSTSEVMVLCERIRDIALARIELISIIASDMRNLSVFSNHEVQLPALERGALSSSHAYVWDLDYPEILKLYLAAIDQEPDKPGRKGLLDSKLIATIMLNLDDEPVIAWRQPYTKTSFAEFEQKNTNRIGSQEFLSSARMLLEGDGAAGLSDQQIHDREKIEKEQSATERLAELCTSRLPETPSIEVTEVSDPREEYDQLIKSNDASLKKEDVRRNLARLYVRKKLVLRLQDMPTSEPKKILEEIISDERELIRRQEQRVIEAIATEAQNFGMQKATLEFREYILAAMEANRPYLEKMCFLVILK